MKNMNSRVDEYSIDREAMYLRDHIVGARITQAWARPDGYILEFDHKLRLEIGVSGADWFSLQPGGLEEKYPPVS